MTGRIGDSYHFPTGPAGTQAWGGAYPDCSWIAGANLHRVKIPDNRAATVRAAITVFQGAVSGKAVAGDGAQLSPPLMARSPDRNREEAFKLLDHFSPAISNSQCDGFGSDIGKKCI